VPYNYQDVNTLFSAWTRQNVPIPPVGISIVLNQVSVPSETFSIPDFSVVGQFLLILLRKIPVLLFLGHAAHLSLSIMAFTQNTIF